MIEFLNSYSGASLSQLALAFGLSRGTVYRLLETLCDDGYVERRVGDGGYVLGSRVRSLSDGYADEQWLKDYAQDRLFQLAESVHWPLKLATLQGFEMVVRASTDTRSPFAHLRTFAGHRVSLIQSAAGLVYLAFCGRDQRQLLIDIVVTSSSNAADVAAARSPALARRLDQIAVDGHAFVGDAQLSMVAVPVRTRRGVFACIAMQFYSRALTRKALLSGQLPHLRHAADDIGNFLDRAQ